MRRNSIMCGMISALLVGAGSVAAMSPPYPWQNITSVPDGQSAPFVGSWSMNLPADKPGVPDISTVTCDHPIRMEAADATHVFYLGPEDRAADAAVELVARDGRTAWEPIAGGPRYSVVWISPDSFHMHEADAVSEQDWAQPLVYERCR